MDHSLISLGDFFFLKKKKTHKEKSFFVIAGSQSRLKQLTEGASETLIYTSLHWAFSVPASPQLNEHLKEAMRNIGDIVLMNHQLLRTDSKRIYGD